MRTYNVHQRNAHGSTLLVTLGILFIILVIVLPSVFFITTSQNRSIVRSQEWNRALTIAEAGVEEALAHINPVGMSAKRPPFAANGWTTNSSGLYEVPSPQRNLIGGYYNVTILSNWDATIPPGDPKPIITATGFVKSPLSSAYGISRTVQVTATRSAAFPLGVAARHGVTMNGNYVSIDSYDSSNTNRFPGGRWNLTNRQDHGDVATLSTAANALDSGNADIRGKIHTGPGGTPNVGAQGSVGDNAWVGGGSKGIKSGWFKDDVNTEYFDVVQTFSGSSLPQLNTNNAYILSTGDYLVSGDFTLTGGNNAQSIVVGDGQNVVLYVTGNFDMKSGAAINIPPNAIMRIYVAGAAATFEDVNNLGNANSFQYYGMPSNTKLTWNGNSRYVGTVYAPSAQFIMNGGGSGPALDFEGACVVDNVTINGHFNIHYDENLARSGPKSLYVATSWQEL